MRRLGLALALWTSFSCAALAQVGGLSFPGPGPGHSAGGGATLTFTVPGATNTGFANGTPTLPGTFSVNSGTASSDRFVVVAIQWIGATGTSNSDLGTVSDTTHSITFTAGSHYWNSTRQYGTAVYYANIPSGTSFTLSISSVGGSGWWTEYAFEIGTITGSASLSVSSTLDTPIDGPPGYANGFTNSNTGSITVATGGVAVLSSISDNTGGTGASPTVVWTGTTSSSSDLIQQTSTIGGRTGYMAHAIASGSVNEAVTASGGGSGWSSVSFQP